MLDLLRLALRRAREDRLPQMAGSLAFTTVLAVVPLFAVSFALFARFPQAFGRFEAALEQHLLKALLPPDIARTVLATLHRFADGAGGLTDVGALFLLATAMALLLTVDNALNQIWRVKARRPLLRRLTLYLLVLALAPPLLGVSLWAMSAVLGASLGLVGPLPPSARFVLQLGPPLLAWLGVAALLRSVPNTRVGWGPAAAGGLIASAALELGKRGFAAYLLQVPTYKTVYGAFAVLPLFLLWVYYSWLVTLAAALVAASLGRTSAARR